jgi:hypothetical protein
MLLLIAACSITSASAMHASSTWQVSTAISRGVQPLGWQPSMQQQAVQYLGHELGSLQRGCFRCFCAN